VICSSPGVIHAVVISESKTQQNSRLNAETEYMYGFFYSITLVDNILIINISPQARNYR
jgi:hypothetical protein